MKQLSSFNHTKVALSTLEMKQLKGGGQCGYLPGGQGGDLSPDPICNLTEDQAMTFAMYRGGSWCCYDCSTKVGRLNTCR